MVYEDSSGYEGSGAGDRDQEAFERAVLGAASWVREATDAQIPCQLWLSGEELASEQDMSSEGTQGMKHEPTVVVMELVEERKLMDNMPTVWIMR